MSSFISIALDVRDAVLMRWIKFNTEYPHDLMTSSFALEEISTGNEILEIETMDVEWPPFEVDKKIQSDNNSARMFSKK
jgi:hypothetical protein